MSHAAELRAAFEYGCRVGRANPHAANELIAAWGTLQYPDTKECPPGRDDWSTERANDERQRGDHQ